MRADLSESDSATHYCIGLDTSKMEMMPAAFPRNIGYISPSRSRAVANANTEDMPTVRWNPTFSKSLPFLGSEHTRPMPQLTMTRSKRSARSARSATLPSPQEFPAPTPDNISEVDSPGTAETAHERAVRIFYQVDVSRSGFVEPQELYDHLLANGGFVTSTARRVFEMLDLNHDGKVSLNEWLYVYGGDETKRVVLCEPSTSEGGEARTELVRTRSAASVLTPDAQSQPAAAPAVAPTHALPAGASGVLSPTPAPTPAPAIALAGAEAVAPGHAQGSVSVPIPVPVETGSSSLSDSNSAAVAAQMATESASTAAMPATTSNPTPAVKLAATLSASTTLDPAPTSASASASAAAAALSSDLQAAFQTIFTGARSTSMEARDAIAPAAQLAQAKMTEASQHLGAWWQRMVG